jgi:hypothetical protein
MGRFRNLSFHPSSTAEKKIPDLYGEDKANMIGSALVTTRRDIIASGYLRR